MVGGGAQRAQTSLYTHLAQQQAVAIGCFQPGKILFAWRRAEQIVDQNDYGASCALRIATEAGEANLTVCRGGDTGRCGGRWRLGKQGDVQQKQQMLHQPGQRLFIWLIRQGRGRQAQAPQRIQQ